MAHSNLTSSFLEMLQAERASALNSIESYKRDMEGLEEFLVKKQKTDLLQASRSDIEAYLIFLSDSGYSPRSAARKLSCFRQFYLFLYSDKLRTDNPCLLIDSPRKGRSLPKTLNQDDIELLLNTAKQGETAEDARLYAMLEVLYASGLRVSELISLKLAAVQNKAGAFAPYILIKGKGGKERIAPLNAPAHAALATYIPQRISFLPENTESPWLFPSTSKEGYLTRQRFGQLLKELAVKAGMPPSRLSPHTIRHSFASHLLKGGADLRVIQELLGHSDISTTQIYTHVEQEALTRLVHDHHPLAKQKVKE